MAKQLILNGYNALRNHLNTLNPGERAVFILFTGNKDENGVSWCGWCQKSIFKKFRQSQ